MQVQIVGGASERLVEELRRRLRTEIQVGLPAGSSTYACVVAGDTVPEGLVDDPRLAVLVLVEPGLQTRDLVVRALAARPSPALEIVEYVSERIQAERTWAILLSMVMRLGEAEAALRESVGERSMLVEGAPPGGSWAGVATGNPAGLTVGCLGFGPMAQAIAARARLSGMDVLYWPQFSDRAHREECQAGALRTGARERPFAEVLKDADIIVLDLAYTAESVRLIDSPELALMRRGAWLVNTSHGRAIDEGALIQTLRSGHLAGAALDRFNYEPLPADSPLRTMDRVILTPGIAVPDESAVAGETARQIAGVLAKHVPDLDIRTVRRETRRQKT